MTSRLRQGPSGRSSLSDGIIGDVETYTPREEDQERRVYALNMPSSMYNQVRQLAHDEDKSIAQWIRQAIRNKITNDGHDPA